MRDDREGHDGADPRAGLKGGADRDAVQEAVEREARRAQDAQLALVRPARVRWTATLTAASPARAWT